MPTLSHEELKTILPQAYPFLLLDKVIDYQKDDYLVAVKQVTGNEWCQDGGQGKVLEYFPETLLIEAAAQAALVLYHVSRVDPNEDPPQYFLGKVKSEFVESFPIMIGDSVQINIKSGKMLDAGGYADAQINAGDQLLVQLELIFKVLKKQHA